MLSRRVLHPSEVVDPLSISPWKAPAPAVGAGWWRKTVALALHVSCLGFFGFFVVWPVASPIARGQLAREFQPVVDVLVAQGWWTACEPGSACPARKPGSN
jgi:hypothetical protein